MEEKQVLTLAIESSCDDTSIAVVKNGREVLSNVISSQIDIFKKYGGVVPEIAARHHLENINSVLDAALLEANVTMDDIDVVAVTNRPGLVGAVLIGVATAKAIAFASNKPLIGVHHIMGHISANFLEYPELEPPFTALIASGGHTQIADVTSYTTCKILGGTRDDAMGEAYDKVARVLGLGYPGGPKIDKIAKEGNPEAINFKRVYLEKDSYDFSFSGLKTQVLNYINQEKQAGRELNRADIAASFQQAMIDVVTDKAVLAAKEMGHKKLALAGGVAANSKLREALKEKTSKEGIELFIPSPILCTDNGAMIGAQGYYLYKEGKVDDLSLDAFANAEL